MNAEHRTRLVLVAASVAATGASAGPEYRWRYYRPSNTGIQGDYCDAIWIGANGDPWIGGYVPSFEEGGLARFVQAENRWVNVSNVDYPEIGHPDDTGVTRVRDIEQDAQGNLWMGTGRGILRFNPAIGPGSLKRYDASNSPWPGGWVTNIEIAPDGSIWASGYSTAWGGGGLMRFDPFAGAWAFLGSGHPEMLAVQPKPADGYYVWAADRPGSIGATDRYDSATRSWTTIPSTSGRPRNLPGSKCVDPAGNLWIYRVLPDGFNTVMDVLRPDGTWVGVPTPPGGGGSVTTAFDVMRALTDGNGQVWKFDGASWTGLGDWGNINWTYDLAIDAAGVVWACGVGGAARRDPLTGRWQRYRVTNTSQYDFWNNDLALDPAGGVYACANAGTGHGGMVRFDGTRWIGFNNTNYGLGLPWPFPTDNSEAVSVRPSNGRVVVNPMFNGTHEFDGSNWTPRPGGSGSVVQYVEDSLGRLWGLGEYFSLGIYESGGFTNHGIAAWGEELERDPDRPGTVWAHAGHELVRTDGAYRFSRTIDDFPELTSQSDTFDGLAVDHDGVAWVGCTVMYGAGGSGGGLIRIDADTGAYTMWRYEAGWPFPGQYVSPLAATPDGRVWMVYDTDYPYTARGLLWWDGVNVGTFPAPPDGGPQWGGLPHAQIYDCEVRELPNGYELWLSCASRGIAVLSVTDSPCYPDCDTSTGRGNLDIFDFLCFQNRFDAGAPYACDCDTSTGGGVCDVFDFLCFQNAFDAGCP